MLEMHAAGGDKEGLYDSGFSCRVPMHEELLC
jgi:hypothetical protein